MVGHVGFEPTTPSSQMRCASQTALMPGRKGWDLNPRKYFYFVRLVGGCLKPLGHLSKIVHHVYRRYGALPFRIDHVTDPSAILTYENWISDVDSNHDKQDQNLLSYH